jgi:putative membrane-bound dehydrogenase-like protein
MRIIKSVAATFLAAWLAGSGSSRAADVEPDIYKVGVAEVDITPAHPVRLNGFGFRRAESEGTNHQIHARALTIRHATDAHPVLLMTVDVLGIPATVRAELAKRLKAKLPPERLAITATHTHCGPMLTGANPTLFGVPIPEDHIRHIDQYTSVFLDKLEGVALAALRDTQPAKLFWGVGTVGFAKNRRTAGGPTDHDLPVLVARDASTNEVRAVYTSYACHCVTLSHNKVGGDWAGYAAEAIRDRFPRAVGLVSIGCGADQNPDAGVTGDKVEAAQVQGRQVADEVRRLLGGYLAPVRGRVECILASLALPLADPPDRKGWEEKARRSDAVGHHARTQLGRLDRREPLATAVDYPVQTWAFGDSLAMVHLPGEVVVDYSARLKGALDRGRLWVTAYTNANPCYIPSERVLKEGGYEGGGAMVYYDLPAPFRPGLEDAIVGEVKARLGARFGASFDPAKTDGGRPLSPQQSLRSLRTSGKFTVDLVAAEPLVCDPVAIAFGPDGKLWVAEMLDYPSGKSGKYEPGGRVRFLEDADGDGVFDRATTFLDGLPFPTGVLPWRGGVLVTAAPDILYAEDTDGDGKADLVKTLFSGFGTENYQARVNGLAYGLDGWVYGSCGLFGGTIVSGGTGKVTALGNRDFRIKPDTGEIEPATGRTQQGRVRNDWGDWFGCDNSNLLWHYALADHYLRRNPHAAAPNPVVSVPAGPDPNRLYPARVPPLLARSGPAGRTTAACGVGVYRDDRLGADLAGDAFTCEPASLLVHHRALRPSGATFVGDRTAADAGSEFLASTDPWFRPVQATTGPDGGLWVADMYRFVIEHPRWIPAADLAKLDVRAGAGLGRVYRVRAEGEAPKAWPRLDKLDAAGLVAALDSPNGWQRDTATELLAWRDDKAALPALRKMARESTRPEARLHALVALDRLGGSTPEVVTAALADGHPGVRRQAARMSEPLLNANEAVAAALVAVCSDGDPKVRQQAAYSLGAWASGKAGGPLAKLALAAEGDAFLTAAVVSSLNRHNLGEFVRRPEVAGLLKTPLLAALTATAVGLGDEPVTAALVQRVTAVEGGGYEAWQFAALEVLLDAWGRSAKGRGRPAGVDAALAAARAVAAAPAEAVALRVAAVRLHGRDPARRAEDIAALGSLLAPQSPALVQSAAIAALARQADDRAAEALVAGWAAYTPSLRAEAVAALLGREAWLPKVLSELSAGRLPASAVPTGARHALLTHPDAKLRASAETVFAGAINADRQRVIETVWKALPKSGDAARGKVAFQKSCANCHRLDGHGQAVGPDLSALANKSAEYLLAEILDPNRNVDSRYIGYVASTADGRSVAGLLASETSAAVTLRAADGRETTLLRVDLESLKSTGRSVMPEGLEKDIPPAAMADLIAYLSGGGGPPKRLPGNAPTLVRVADGALTLRAAEGEVRGDTITFEAGFSNLGFWHGANDHVTWRAQTPAAAGWDVYLDYACDGGSAGNAFALEGGEPTLRGTITGTGTWADYRWVKVGTLKLPEGVSRITLRPDGGPPRSALADVRTVLLVPAGHDPKLPGSPRAEVPPTDAPGDLACFLLDDAKKSGDREAAVARCAGKAAAVIRAMTAGPFAAREERRRIPWVWRVAAGAGTRNRAEELQAVLEVSLPEKGAPLREWQAVVVGGGVINKVSRPGVWPGPRLAEVIGRNRPLAGRWASALEMAALMADDKAVPSGTRYDALRMVAMRGWEAAGGQLKAYLAAGTDAELQMGAVSGLADLDSPGSVTALVAALAHLTGENRKLALAGLLATEARAASLLDAVEVGAVKPDALGPAVVTNLRESKWGAICKRAATLLRH